VRSPSVTLARAPAARVRARVTWAWAQGGRGGREGQARRARGRSVRVRMPASYRPPGREVPAATACPSPIRRAYSRGCPTRGDPLDDLPEEALRVLEANLGPGGAPPLACRRPPAVPGPRAGRPRRAGGGRRAARAGRRPRGLPARDLSPWPTRAAGSGGGARTRRAILDLDAFHVPRRLERTVRQGRYEVRADSRLGRRRGRLRRPGRDLDLARVRPRLRRALPARGGAHGRGLGGGRARGRPCTA
jgi:hypothetical protein